MISRSDLAKIHIAKKQLAMDDDTYRTMLRSVGGAESARDLNKAGADAVLSHLKRCGFRPTRNGGDDKTRSGRVPDDAQSDKLRMLWRQLHELGAVRNPSDAALASYVKRQTGIAALQWLSTMQASHVIEALKKWIARVQQGATP
ncbi:gp16 family protein [Paraburkholderia sp. BR14263]